MKPIVTVSFAVVLGFSSLSAASGTTPIQAAPVKEVFAAFEVWLPKTCAPLILEMRRLAADAREDAVRIPLENVVSSFESIRDKSIPELRSGFAEKKPLEEMLPAFEALAISLTDLRTNFDELVIELAGRKLLLLDERRRKALREFWEVETHYRFQFGPFLQGNVREDKSRQ